MYPKPIRSKSSVSTTDKTQGVHLARYVGFFTLGYVLASTLFMLIQSKFALNAQLVVVISVLIGSFVAVHKFIKHQRRALNRSEANRLSVASVVVVWLLTALFFAALWLWLFDSANRAVFMETVKLQSAPLLSALVLMIVLTLVSARLGILLFNRSLAPK